MLSGSEECGRWIPFTVFMLTATSPVEAQSRSPFPADEPLVSAVQHGRSFVAPDSLFPPPDIPEFRNFVGTAERVCVEAPPDMKAVVRSGEIFIGGSLGIPLAEGRMKIWWNPQSAEIPVRLEVFGQNLDEPSKVLEWSSDFATYASGDERVAANLFFPGMITFPAPGRWVLIGTSGSSWGCFVVDAIAPESRGGVV